ncbi:unnamed protein product [marine sediment metagenome]|uniref:Uncharacterized protein n=1 Tax=marine sediment metagenome TaxID=412755 RepID=X1NJI0_9ZZZZ
MQEAFKFGILYNKLTDEELGNLDTVLRRFDYIGEGMINDKIKA